MAPAVGFRVMGQGTVSSAAKGEYFFAAANLVIPPASVG